MEIVKKNRGRHKRSYMEVSFSKWLQEHNILHKTEVHFYNKKLGKNYFVDFLFEDIHLIIELDGTQHEDTKEEDAIRDLYFTNLGYTVIRIPYKEYQKKTYIPILKKLLNIKEP